MKEMEAGPLVYKLLQGSPKHSPSIAPTASIAAASSTSTAQSPQVRAPSHSPLSTAALGICTLADASRGPGQPQCSEVGAEAPASPVAVISSACTLACTEPATLTLGAPRGQLAGIFLHRLILSPPKSLVRD